MRLGRPKQLAPIGRKLTRLLLVAALIMTGQAVFGAASAFAATTVTVSTTADTGAAAGACGNPAITTPASPLSLREATCLASNVGGEVTINVPSGTYLLANGELQVGTAAGHNVSIVGAGAASTVVNGQGLGRVFDLDPNLTGGVTVSMSGMTVTGGADSGFGGAGIIGGSGNSADIDVLTLTGMIVTGNVANAATPTETNKPGGGLQFLGGRLTITNSVFSNNNSYSSRGAGLVYGAYGSGVEGLTINGSTFSGNTMTNSNGSPGVSNGGALAVFGPATIPMTVTDSRFVNNTVTATTARAFGAGIWHEGGALTVIGSTFTGNSVSGGPSAAQGGAIGTSSGSLSLQYNRFVGNVAAAGQAVAATASPVAATNSWWGCNTGPGTAGCDSTSGTVVASPRLVLTATASPTTVSGPNGVSTISGAFTTNSAGNAVAASNLGAFATLPVTFSDPPGDAVVGGSVGAKTAPVTSGAASIGFNSNTSVGTIPVNVSFDNATATAQVQVVQPPAITSAATTNFTVGSAGSFTITTTGSPGPVLSISGTLPSGVTFTDNGNGTATLAGTPVAGSGGTYPLTITANNGVNPNAAQNFTLTVGSPPAFTSPSSAIFTAGTAGSFGVTTSGVPAVTALTQTSGVLPAGLTFTAAGSGATIAGTPAAGTGGVYSIGLQAVNGIAPNANQTLTIQVNEAPAVTTDPASQTVNPGASVTFAAAATGYPAPTVQWQVSTDGGGNFNNIPGATSTSLTFTAGEADSGNRYRAVFTNSVNTATTTGALLTVGLEPTISSANATTFTVGTAGSFTVTTSGFPDPTITIVPAPNVPAWLTLTAGPDGTATLTGTPPTGAGGVYSFTLTADNGFLPSDSQAFVLTVNEPPTITSANNATFTINSAGAFTVTTSVGEPETTTISAPPGDLPPGLTFVDNADGTATLSGTPTADGVFTFTITATNGVAPNPQQTFTATVNGPPAITSGDNATFAVGTAGSFTVTTDAGTPPETQVTTTGLDFTALGLTFTPDDATGTATISGTPVAGAGGTYTFSVFANNAVGGSAQSFTLTIEERATVTSADNATFLVGAAGSFLVTTEPGFPTATTVAATVNGTGDPLPAWLTFTDNADGTATLAGTAPLGAGGTLVLDIAATNTSGTSTQVFTLTITEAATITSADNTTFAVGTAGTFTVTTAAGTPPATQVTATGTDFGALGLTFTPDDATGTANLSGTPVAGSGGTYSFTVTATNAAAATTQAFTLTIEELPSITSADNAAFLVGTAGSFGVTTAPGFPAATTLAATVNGTGDPLPAWLTFTDNTGGTATLTGTPPVGAGGTLVLDIAATNTSGTSTQLFTLTINEAATITSADNTTFAVGATGSFTFTTTAGTPPETRITATGQDFTALGLTFTPDDTNGTATLSGTPIAGSGGTYSFTVSAANTATTVSQTFTLTINELPSITSADSTSFVVGTPGTFAITTDAGFPVATTLAAAISGTGDPLPAWLTFTDNGDGTATLDGTPPVGNGGVLTLDIDATNSSGSITQVFTLTLNESPTISSPASATFTANTAGTFTITTDAGFPVPTITIAGSLPTGVSLIDNADGTATLAGTPTSGGVYPLTITASNGVDPDAVQAFTLTVNAPPNVTSPDTVTFISGVSSSFTVTTEAGTPSNTTLTVAGTLPSGITFETQAAPPGLRMSAAAPGTSGVLSGTTTETGTFPITITASNGIDPDSVQNFVLQIVEATPVELPATLPESDGPIGGVSPTTPVGQQLVISGSGCAAGAPVTVGYYEPRTVLGETVADENGNFSISVTAPTTPGPITLVASCIAVDGTDLFLTAATTITDIPVTPVPSDTGTSPVPTTSVTSAPGPTVTTTATTPGGGTKNGNLSYTGAPVTSLLITGLGVLLIGAMLLLVARSRKPRQH